MPQTVDLAYLSIAEAGALFRRRELSPVELVNALLERSERLQGPSSPTSPSPPSWPASRPAPPSPPCSGVRAPHRC